MTTPSYDWTREFLIEVALRASLDIVACSEAWALDEHFAVVYHLAEREGDVDAGQFLVSSVANSIAMNARSAFTRNREAVQDGSGHLRV